jgi:hypothetical protein
MGMCVSFASHWALFNLKALIVRSLISFRCDQVALRLASLLSKSSHQTTSLIRTSSHELDIQSVNASPHLLSLEDAPTSEFTEIFTDKDVVYFCAGAGASGGDDRTKKVDYGGAVKVMDAIEGIDEGKGKRPRLVLLSAIDVRDYNKIPEHYVRVSLSLTVLVCD